MSDKTPDQYDRLNAWFTLEWADLIEALAPNQLLYAVDSAAYEATFDAKNDLKEIAISPEVFTGSLTAAQKLQLRASCQLLMVMAENIQVDGIIKNPGLAELTRMRAQSALHYINSAPEIAEEW